MNQYFRIERSNFNLYFLSNNNIEFITDGKYAYIFLGKTNENLLDQNISAYSKLLDDVDIKYELFIDRNDQFTKQLENPERKVMLTVKDLIDFLQKQDPEALILSYEVNSGAFISQFKELPNRQVCTVQQCKKDDIKYWTALYEREFENDPNKDEKIKEKIHDSLYETYRYARNKDVVISF